MSRASFACLALLALLALVQATTTMGCSSDDGAARDAAAFALLGGSAPASLRDTPWPCDVLLRDGHIALTDVALEGGQPGPLTALAAALSELDGAPSYTSAFFPIDGDLPDGMLAGTARWIDLDAANAAAVTGSLFSRKDTREVVALAPQGVLWEEGHHIGVIVEAPALRASSPMRDALDGKGPFAPSFAALAPHLVGRSASAATVFTVGRPTIVAEQMRDVAAALPVSRAKATRVYVGTAGVDELFGRPTTTRPGLGDAAGIVHDRIEAAILGTFPAPSFLTPTPPQLGRVEAGPDGRPQIKGTQEITFMLTLPQKPAGGWPRVPVLIFQHGLNAGRSQVASVANDYARAGYATIGIDALWHADRGLGVKDVVHNFSGAAGPDGLADADDFGASVSVFDFNGDPARGIGPLDGRYVRDNFRQAFVDLAELARFLKNDGLATIADADPAFAGLTFDTSTLVYTSESFGSVIGMGGFALSPDLRGAILSVGGGGIFLPILPSSPMFTGLVAPLLRGTFDPALDVTDPTTLPGAAQRSLSLLQAAFAPGDPLGFAPKLATQQKSLLLLQARSDELIPNQATELLAVAARATSVSLPSRSEPPRFAVLPIANAPYEAGPSTRAVVQLSRATHTMFTGFVGDQRYEPDFPPFVPLAAPVRIDNPIELAHELALGFTASLRSGGPGRVEALAR